MDRFSVAQTPAVSAEGYRLLWYHSTRKAELDAAARAGRIQRATRQLDELRQRLTSPRTRYRQRAKVAEAVEEILTSCEVDDWISVEIEERIEERYRQERKGRPSKDTRYVKQVSTRFDLSYQIDHGRIAEDQRCDGVFPLVTNVVDLSEVEVLLVYKRQPVIEKRFSQLKTDFRVAPVYLKEVSRIQALLCVYFLVLLVESLLERELRQAMEREEIESLPMYPEDRPCRRPTARRVIDLFDDIQRHTLDNGRRCPGRLRQRAIRPPTPHPQAARRSRQRLPRLTCGHARNSEKMERRCSEKRLEWSVIWQIRLEDKRFRRTTSCGPGATSLDSRPA